LGHEKEVLLIPPPPLVIVAVVESPAKKNTGVFPARLAFRGDAKARPNKNVAIGAYISLSEIINMQ